MATAETDRLVAWVEELSNPFLLREWRRRTRRGRVPVHGPVVLCALATLFFVALLSVSAVAWRLFNLSPGEAELPPSMLSAVARGLGTFLVGALAWLTLALAHWLSTGQTAVEERRETLDLLLVAPLSRARVLRLLTAWPLLCVVAFLFPLTPLFVTMTPFMGLSTWAAGRTLLIILAMAGLIVIRGPSGAGSKPTAGQRNLQTIGLQVTVAFVAVPWMGSLAARYFGLPGLGILRWPTGCATLLVSHRPLWSGDQWLGPWLLLFYVLVLAARWLSAWERLCEGGEWRPLPSTAASFPAWVLALWWLAGLWWGRSSGAGRDVFCWYAMHLAVLAFLLVVLLRRGRSPWLVLWLPARLITHPAAVAALHVVDLLLAALTAPLVWWLGTRQAGLSTTPPNWGAFEELVAAALMLGALRLWADLSRGGDSEDEPERFSVRAFRNLAVAVVACAAAAGSQRFYAVHSTAAGWPSAFFGWGSGLAEFGIVAAVVLSLALGVAGTWRQRRRGVAAADGPAQPLWRIAPRAWRENPLVIKAGRISYRRGFRRSGVALLILTGLGGLLLVPWIELVAPALTRPGVPPVMVAPSPGGSATPTVLVPAAPVPPAVEMTQAVVDWGQGFAHYLTGKDCLSYEAAGMLTQILWTSVLLLGGLLLTGTVACGRIVTEERIGGSLGLLLLSDLSDRELADGWLVGQAHAVLEMLAVYVLVAAAWGVASGSLLVMAVTGIVVCMVAGLVLCGCALAFLGTARYAARANGTAGALAGLVLFQAVTLATVAVITAFLNGKLHAVPLEWYLTVAGLWAALTLLSGGLLWRAGADAVHRMRRTTRLWLAFDTLQDREQVGS